MTGPLFDVIADLEGLLRRVGFSVVKHADFDAVLSASGFFVYSSIEQHYPSSLSMYVLTPKTNRYEVGLLEEVIDPRRRELDLSELSQAFETLELDPNDLGAQDAQSHLRAYLRMIVVKMLDFLVAHKSVVFDTEETYRELYLEKSRARRSKLGVL